MQSLPPDERRFYAEIILASLQEAYTLMAGLEENCF